MDRARETDRKLSRTEASAAVGEQGWRYLLGTLRTSVPVASLAQGAEVAARAVAACGADADGHLRVDVRPERAVLTLQSLAHGAATARDVELAHAISAAVASDGLRTTPEIGGGSGAGTGAPRSVQMLEIAIDTLDMAAILPFWQAVLGYDIEPAAQQPYNAIVDPIGQGPAFWFQPMDEPRPQRNRIHFDMCVPHDEAKRRINAALAAGGRLLSDTAAPAFWVLADAEGNEVCVTTWQGRDPRPV